VRVVPVVLGTQVSMAVRARPRVQRAHLAEEERGLVVVLGLLLQMAVQLAALAAMVAVGVVAALRALPAAMAVLVQRAAVVAAVVVLVAALLARGAMAVPVLSGIQRMAPAAAVAQLASQ
jgi:hypothetical protein